jgi:hypothetical protein
MQRVRSTLALLEQLGHGARVRSYEGPNALGLRRSQRVAEEAHIALAVDRNTVRARRHGRAET